MTYNSKYTSADTISKYICSHLDIAGSSGNLPDPTTGASVAAIVKWLMK